MVVNPPLLSITTVIGAFSWKAASILSPPERKAPSPLITTAWASGWVSLAATAKDTPTPSMLNTPGCRIPPNSCPRQPEILIAISDQKWVLPPSITSQSLGPMALCTSNASCKGCTPWPGVRSLSISARVCTTHSPRRVRWALIQSSPRCQRPFSLRSSSAFKNAPGSLNRTLSAARLSSVSSAEPLTQMSLHEGGNSGALPKFI